MEKICDWMRSLTEAKLEYGLFWGNAEQEAERRPALAKDCVAYASPAPTSVELTTGAEPGGTVLCLVTGTVFTQGPFEMKKIGFGVERLNGPDDQVDLLRQRRANFRMAVQAVTNGVPAYELDPTDKHLSATCVVLDGLQIQFKGPEEPVVLKFMHNEKQFESEFKVRDALASATVRRCEGVSDLLRWYLWLYGTRVLEARVRRALRGLGSVFIRYNALGDVCEVGRGLRLRQG
eukprot:COSAG04_NODE_3006_length_3285_cov_1.590709_5_plen_234_part_00